MLFISGLNGFSMQTFVCEIPATHFKLELPYAALISIEAQLNANRRAMTSLYNKKLSLRVPRATPGNPFMLA